MRKVLLHTCCAPCSAAIIEWLLGNDWQPVLFFYNPNISPQEEYDIRKTEIVRYAQKLSLEIIDGDYDHEKWLSRTSHLAGEPERGERCLECFRQRLLETAKLAAKLGIDTFTTTLASSRWKDLNQISTAGSWAAGEVPGTAFWDRNWRKEGLTQRRSELLRENGFYNQTYCGCEFSKR